MRKRKEIKDGREWSQTHREVLAHVREDGEYGLRVTWGVNLA